MGQRLPGSTVSVFAVPTTGSTGVAAVAVGDGVDVEVGVDDGVTVGVGDAVAVEVGLGVRVGVGVNVAVGVSVAVGVGVGPKPNPGWQPARHAANSAARVRTKTGSARPGSLGISHRRDTELCCLDIVCRL